MAKPLYRYARPDKQLEEAWFDKLTSSVQEKVKLATQQGIRARRDLWNATQPSHRHIPRPD